jgi:homoserine kinase
MNLSGKTLEIRVPASSANLGPGFDCACLALNRYTTLRISDSATLEVVPMGETLAGTPSDSSNFVYEILLELFERVGVAVPPLRLEIESEIPLARGLGSSSAAIIAALLGANAYLEHSKLATPLSYAEILDLASFLEGHPDNVGAALYGGAIFATWDGSRTHLVKFDCPARLAALVVIPRYMLKTEVARGVLPAHYSREDTVHALSHAALLAAAFASGKLELLAEAMTDRVHQPYRAPLVKGLPEILEGATKYGALGAALSGAGPSVLCLYDSQAGTLELLQEWLSTLLETYGFDASLNLLEVDGVGAVVRVL